MAFQKNSGAVRRFQKLVKFASWIQEIPNKVTPAPFRLMQIGSAFWQSRCLYLAARFDIASIIADATMPVAEIAATLRADPDALYRLLRMLAAMGIFDERAERCFANNTLSSYLRSDHPQNVRAMILMHDSDAMSRPWYEELERGVRDAIPPFVLAHGEGLFDYMNGHPDFDALFSEAMECVEALAGDSYATDFDWGQFDRLIDVGGSRGGKSISILKRHPHLEALVIDRPRLIEGAEAHWAGRLEADLLARLRFKAGDALEALPAARGARDIYLLSGLLHGFDDDGAAKVLRNLAAAIGESGARGALLEMVMPERGASLAAASFDMQMFMGTRGRERTAGEWRRLFDGSGLRLEEEVDLRSFVKILVLRRG